ncbi:uncharacterized protein LOC128678306 [Plodia interpunctella]|uniref:uncharacterized protein LOC128678306 n=1 Tax=Plodia interpunctella TaxID=58824 RepID=UPI002367CCE5|nr:uncharacterized protein LOC128678306 [Plodia interpunctella]
MTAPISRYRSWCLGLRVKCFIVAYMNLFASVVDIICHVLVVAITTNCFQCDVTESSIREVAWPWLEPILMAVNIGTHGFYPLPLTFTQSNFIEGLMPTASEVTCYPGMFHVYMVDVFNFAINIIWLHLVKSFLRGVHRKDPEPMRMFFGIGILKLILQIMYFGYQPEFRSISNADTLMFIKLLDICMSGLFLLIIYEYIKVVVDEKKRETTRVVDQPPSYIECLIGSSKPKEEDLEKVVLEQPAQTPVTHIASISK